jgi:hypothetical protein
MNCRHTWIIGDVGSMEVDPGEGGCMDKSLTHPSRPGSSSASEAELREAIDSMNERCCKQRVLPSVLARRD